jgi:hypothetical protein
MNKAKAVSALELYVEDLRGNSRPQEGAIGVGRQSAINDLVDTAKLLKSLEVDDDIWKRFYDLAHALDDLKHGIVSPVLKAADVHNRASDNSAVWGARAKVAVALECLLRGGMSPKEAASIVSRRRSLNPLLRQGTNLETAPLNWHRNLRRRQNKNEAAQIIWEEFQEACSGELKFTPDEWKIRAEGFLLGADKDLRALRSAK